MALIAVLMSLFLFGSSTRIITAESENCHTIVPGIVRMTRGVDITSLNLFPSDLRTSNGFRHSLFELTCSKNFTWTHPAIPNSLYSLPDQVATINTVPAVALKIKTEFYENPTEYKSSLNQNVGLGLGFDLIGSFSSNANYKEVREQIWKSNKTIAETSACVSAVQVDFRSSYKMKLSEHFIDLVEELPMKFSDAPELYNQFIHQFGTHYFETGIFGGYFYQITKINNTYLHETNTTYVTEKIKKRFLFFFRSYSYKNYQFPSTSTTFSSSNETNFYYYGGKTDLSNQRDNNNYVQNWFATIAHDPWLFGGQLIPVENLIRNRIIRKEMKKAILVYKLKAYLKDLQNSLSVINVRLPNDDWMNYRRVKSVIYDDTSKLNDLMESGEVIGNLIDRLQSIKSDEILRNLFDTSSSLTNGVWNCYYETISPCLKYLVNRDDRFAFLYQMSNHTNSSISINNRTLENMLKDKPDYGQIQEMIPELEKLIQDLQKTNTNWCTSTGNSEYCQRCRLCLADRLYTHENKCNTPLAWRIMDYQPKTFNRNPNRMHLSINETECECTETCDE